MRRPTSSQTAAGLYLLIQPSGSKLWRLKYRNHGVERLLSFGPYPDLSLSNARAKRDEAKRLLAEGTVPVVRQDMWPLSDDADLLFPSIRSASKPLSENALNVALRRMGFGPDEMASHGFRASASTILNEREFNPDVIEAALAHQHENEIRRVYNRAAYWKERVAMMQTWADLLDEFRTLPPEKSPPPKKK